MPFADGTINLRWAAHFDNALGLGTFALADSGQISLLQRDSGSQREYVLSRVDEDRLDALEKPLTHQVAIFASDPIGDAEPDCDAMSLFLLNDTAVHFLSVASNGELSHGMLQIRIGDSFLGLKAAGIDSNKTAAILTTDRSQAIYTLSLLEAPVSEAAGPGAQSVALTLLWNKAWDQEITALSISRDGRYVAIATGRGDVVLLSRERRAMWANTATENSPVVALAVDLSGSVVTLEDSGRVKMLSGLDGSINWEQKISVSDARPPSGIRRGYCAIDDNGGLVFLSINVPAAGSGLSSIYAFFDGSTGNVLWRDTLNCGTSGVSICASGAYAALGNMVGETLLFASEHHKPQYLADAEAVVKPTDMPMLVKKASVAFEAYRYERAVEFLVEAARIDPAVGGHVQLYEDSIWNLREVILHETTEVSRESLEKVEAALVLIPHDEKLTVRRNALARIIAENMGKEAGQRANAGEVEKAVSILREALTIDPSQNELRQTLRSVTDIVAIRLFSDADSALQDENFQEAIEILIRLEALRPGEEAVVKRLEHARGIQAFATGMRCYIKARYTEACFWYRKALAMTPEHPEAKRYLEMATRFGTQKPQKEEPLKPIWANPSFAHERTSTV